ncbi:MAG: DoxX family protein [Actinomycetota bacterium]|nr:DoxX family protein [Actinomycetota bacterium]
MDVLILLGRILLSVHFVFSGLMFHIGKREMAAQFAQSKGVPAAALAVPLSGIVAVVGGLMVLLGIYADLGALLLLIFILPTSFFMHVFWKEQDPQEQANQQVHFFKNVQIAGGALLVFVLFAYGGEAVGLTITDPLFELTP